jgi:hypothetical protein
MEASIRPWFTTGVALVGASAIALTPITPMAPSRPTLDVAAVSTAVSREFQLTALDIPYILTLPIVRQYILNEVENIAVYLAGFGKAGVGLAQSLLSIPGVTVEVIQEVLALNFVGAFDTITSAIRDSVIAVGQPLLDSLIWRNQKYYLVQAALRAAVPLAFIDVTNGFLQAGNLVVTSLIEGTQNLIAAILSLNLGNIVGAAVDGTKNFVVALGDGAGAIVDGIEAAQFGIATALATPPPPPPTFAGAADVSALRTFSADNTVTLAPPSGVLDSAAPAVDESGATEEISGVADPVEGDPVIADAEPVVKDEKPVVDAVKDEPKETPVATTPEKSPPVTSVKDTVEEPEKVTGVEKSPGVDKPAGPKDDDGADAKAASGAAE